MVHSVFQLGDTLVREVMVPRTDLITIERFKTVRQGLTLALRSGFSRIPVVGEERIHEERPDYVLIFPWNLRDEVMEQLDYIRAWGGQFVTAIPALHIQ